MLLKIDEKKRVEKNTLAKGWRLQKRWRFCQSFARDLYHSDFSDDELTDVAASIVTAMRAREEATQYHVENIVESEGLIT